MPDLPLLRLPEPSPVAAPRRRGGGDSIEFPSGQRQRDRFGPVFGRLKAALGQEAAPMELRSDPTTLAPERVIVFEIAGTIDNFLKAVNRIPGLEFLAEVETEFAPDEDFVVRDSRKGKEGQYRADKNVPGRFYLALPDLRALQELLRLWERWERGEKLGKGYAPIAHLFEQLHVLRPWGPQDRISEDTLQFWREESERHPGLPVRTDVELWFRDNARLRETASRAVRQLVSEGAGSVVHESVIPEIAYHGMLIDIPAGDVQALMGHRAVKLALADEVMFLRPQGVLVAPLDVEPEPDTSIQYPSPGSSASTPIAALLDGVPLQSHHLLDGRLTLDDPDDLQAQALVSRRVHGTAMASLILHGDLNESGPSLQRPLYVRPLLVAGDQGHEHTQEDRLLVDTIYRAVVGMKGTESQPGTAPNVFLINLSIGDRRRPYAGMISPLARLLDFLADRYSVLFLVSGGNVLDPLTIPGFANWTEFQAAAPDVRQRAVLTALNAAKHARTILSPAESLNALSIGAQHHDHVEPRLGIHSAVDPFEDNCLPNVSSAIGLGYRRMVKPELYLPGGREHVRFRASGSALEVTVGAPQRLYGVKAAAPDPLDQGRLDQTALTGGTSSATALATRAGHRIFDGLMDTDGGSLLADIDPAFYAVVVKTLLVHTARWNGNHELLKEICGPEDKRKHIERADNTTRFVGFGIPELIEALECSRNRVTLVGYGALAVDAAHQYRIPLPPSLERVTDPRFLTVTVGWFSPIRPGHQSYRGVRLEAEPVRPPIEVLGVERSKGQPADASMKRGSIFHERFEGSSAVPFLDDGHLGLRVWCKEDAGANGQAVRYGIAVTIDAGTPIPIYEEIQQRLRIRPRPRS